MEERKIRVAITQGDPNGIGYELIFKSFATQEMLELCTPVIYGSPKVATYHRKALGLQTQFSIVSHVQEVRDGRINIVTTSEEEVKIELGKTTQEGRFMAKAALDKALEDYERGGFDVLVMAPMQEEDLHTDGSNKTLAQYIADKLGINTQPIYILHGEKINVATVTPKEMPLKTIAQNIHKDAIITKAKGILMSLKRDLNYNNPRLAVLSLNSEEAQTISEANEEHEIIVPAVKQLVAEGDNVFGPYTTESIFATDQYQTFDAILAMYYEQAVVPFQSLSNQAGAWIITGLPLVCTTAHIADQWELAGKGVIDEQPFRDAIYAAIDVCRNRHRYDVPYANPLKKIYHEKRDDSDKVRFATGKKNETTDEEGTTEA